MHAPVRVTYLESGAHRAEAAKQAPVKSRERTWPWIAIIVGVVVLSSGKAAWEQLRKGASPIIPILSGLFVCVIVAGWFFLFQRLFGARKTKQEYYDKLYRQQTGKAETKVVCEFGEVGFLITTDGGVASHFPWPTVVRIVERDSGLLIFTGPELFHWFPRAAFSSTADFSAVLALIADKVPNFERPRASA
jgi:hypothetical protein